MESLDHWLDSSQSEPLSQLTQMTRGLGPALQKTRRGFILGDLSTLLDGLQELESASRGLQECAASMRDSTKAFDVQQFLRDRFETDFRRACAEKGLSVEGTYPTYLVPPLTVQVDLKASRIRLSRKLHRGLRISRIVDAIISERDRIIRRPFNARQFLRELAEAYDELVALEGAQQGGPLTGIERSLKQVYRRLTPRRWRAQYPEAFYAYDLHRLLSSDELYLPDGRRFYLSPSRDARTNLTILDKNEREVQYGVVAFRKE